MWASDFSLSDLVPYMITVEDNILLKTNPNTKKVKRVIFELNNDCSYGPDCFIVHFYQVF